MSMQADSLENCLKAQAHVKKNNNESVLSLKGRKNKNQMSLFKIKMRLEKGSNGRRPLVQLSALLQIRLFQRKQNKHTNKNSPMPNFRNHFILKCL